MKNKYSILYLTDLYYNADGRKYYEEDLYLTSRLRQQFEILLCHPRDSKKFEEWVDVVVFRNTGPVINYKDYFNDFVSRINKKRILSYNCLLGNADTKGKGYLIKLTQQGYPVIPSIESLDYLYLLPSVINYMIKPIDGADSFGIHVVNKKELLNTKLAGKIVQPFINFIYEVSFYFIDNDFQYALYAPDKSKRWDLKVYDATSEDLEFANKFIEWNSLPFGIQRVDACRTLKGELLLIELEDLNPYLSIDLLNYDLRENFLNNFSNSITKSIDTKLQF